MADQTVHAIVLRREKSGETDRRITILTQELGKIDAVAKGASKAASRLAAVSEPMCASILTLAKGRSGRTFYVTQAQPLFSFPGLRSDFDRLQYGLSLAEFAAGILPWGAPFPHYFEVLASGLAAIEHHEEPLVGLIWSLLRILDAAGLLPQFDRCVETQERLQHTYGYLSPSAHGYVSESRAAPYGDRYRVRAEALIGLSKVAELERPPPRLKFAKECFFALYPLCLAAVDAPLPALTAVRDSLHLDGQVE